MENRETTDGIEKVEIIWGIDPGVTGAVAKIEISSEQGVFVGVRSLPVVVGGALQGKVIDSLFLYNLLTKEQSGVQPICYLERIWGWPRLNSTNLCTICRNYGLLLSALTIAGIRIVEISARTWQSRILPEAFPGKTKKEVIKFVEKFFPDVNLILPMRKIKSNDLADALSIAFYGLLERNPRLGQEILEGEKHVLLIDF